MKYRFKLFLDKLKYNSFNYRMTSFAIIVSLIFCLFTLFFIAIPTPGGIGWRQLGWLFLACLVICWIFYTWEKHTMYEMGTPQFNRWRIIFFISVIAALVFVMIQGAQSQAMWWNK